MGIGAQFDLQFCGMGWTPTEMETDAAVGEEIAGVAASRTALETDFRPVLLTLKSSGTQTNAI